MKLASLEPQTARRAMADFGEDARPRPDCPPPEEIWLAVEGEWSAENARVVVEHIAECPACAEAWDLTRELVEASREIGSTKTAAGKEEIGETMDRAKADAERPWRLWLGIAATLVLAVGLAWMSELPGPYRGPDRGGIGEITNELTDSTLPRDACLLVWSGPAGAESYRLELQWSTSNLSGELPAVPRIESSDGQASHLVSVEDLSDVPEGARLEFTITALRRGKKLNKKTFSVNLR